MSSLLVQRKRQNLLDAARADIVDADRRLSDVLLSADLDFAFWGPEGQEGEAGVRHGAATEKLRQAVTLLRGLDLPDVEDLG